MITLLLNCPLLPQYATSREALKLIRFSSLNTYQPNEGKDVRKPTRRSAVLALLTIFVSAIGITIPAAAHAGPTDLITLSHSSGRAGQAVSIEPTVPCPAISSGSYTVWGYFTDAASTVHELYLASTPETGVWDPATIKTPVTTAVGAGSLQVSCIEDGQTASALDYAPEPYTVAAAATAAASQASYFPGDTVHIVAATPCSSLEEGIGHEFSYADDSGGTDVASNFSVDWSNNDETGIWDLHFKVPRMVHDSNGELSSPAGDYKLRFTCTIDGRSTYYADALFTIDQLSLNYVAMGDSFSSGEGVPPFETGTAVPGTNECHRSTVAYPRVLEARTNLNLDLGTDGFTACSGGTTSSIHNGYNGEDAQVNSVNGATDLITMTIGGNNMPFEDFAKACANPLTSCDGTAYADAIAGISNNVIPRIETMLTLLEDDLDTLNSNADVLVVGYPQMVPEDFTSGACWWEGSGEHTAIREVVETLNTAIENEVEAIGGRFHFVSATEEESPFAGGELCRDSPAPGSELFNNLNLSQPDVYNFHPNASGQQAYADLIESYLDQHPLD
jgi:lysophospholipase L1-like esterase